jgi:hypothetical protein
MFNYHNKRKSTGKFTVYDMTYMDIIRVPLFHHCMFLKNQQASCCYPFQDYDDEPQCSFPIDLPFAYCFVELRTIEILFTMRGLKKNHLDLC